MRGFPVAALAWLPFLVGAADVPRPPPQLMTSAEFNASERLDGVRVQIGGEVRCYEAQTCLVWTLSTPTAWVPFDPTGLSATDRKRLQACARDACLAEITGSAGMVDPLLFGIRADSIAWIAR